MQGTLHHTRLVLGQWLLTGSSQQQILKHIFSIFLSFASFLSIFQQSRKLLLDTACLPICHCVQKQPPDMCKSWIITHQMLISLVCYWLKGEKENQAEMTVTETDSSAISGHFSSMLGLAHKHGP